jgi:hypothetical protein
MTEAVRLAATDPRPMLHYLCSMETTYVARGSDLPPALQDRQHRHRCGRVSSTRGGRSAATGTSRRPSYLLRNTVSPVPKYTSATVDAWPDAWPDNWRWK